MADYYYNYLDAVQHAQSVSDAMSNSLTVGATTQPLQATFTRGSATTSIAVPTAVAAIQTRSQFANMVLVQGTMRWIYLTVAVLGLINNLAVIGVFVKVKKLRQQPRNWYIFYQSMADCVSAAFLVAIVFRTAVTSFSGWSGVLVCALWVSNVPLNASTLASAYILAAFTIEVYMAIVHPVLHRNIFTWRLVSVTVAGAWAIGIGYPLGLSLGISRVINGACSPYFMWNIVGLPMGIVNFIVKLVIPITIFSISYILTLTSLRARAKVTAAAIGQPLHEVNCYSRASNNVAITVLYTTIIHAVAWTGNQVQILLTVFGHSIDTSTPLYQAFLLAIYLNCCINPVIYVVKYKEFRNALKRIILKRQKRYKSHQAKTHSTANDPTSRI